MRPRVNNSVAVLQRRQAQLRGASSHHNHVHHNSNSTNGASGKDQEGMELPKVDLKKVMYSHHIPTPDLSPEGSITFEVIIFAYSMVSMMLQLLHLYRSVFWLQNGYNNNAVNWYLIEWQLVNFAGILLSRRLIWWLIKGMIQLVTPAHWTQSFVIVARSVTSLGILVTLFVLLYHTMQKYPILNLLYLVYPVFVYFVVFGLAGEPFLSLTPPSSSGRIKIFKDKTGSFRTSYSLPTSSPSPENARLESKLLRQDFNMRLKQVGFNAICSAYYATVVPCLFSHPSLHYDMMRAGRHVILVWIGSSMLYACHLFPGAYVHMMHRCASYLGHWTKIEGRVSPNFYNLWTGHIFWPQSHIVRYGKGNDLFKAEGVANAAEPGDEGQVKFYTCFRDLSTFSCVLVVMQSGLILAQHVFLTFTTEWYLIISEAIMLFANYYVMYKVLRDYRVFAKLADKEKDHLLEMEAEEG